MADIWDKSNIPRKGWRCINVIDFIELADGYATCEMCGNHSIRFVHVMEHDGHDESLRVGRVCAGHMSNDYVNPKARETRLKNKATRKHNWLSLKWRLCMYGKLPFIKDGMRLTAFPNKIKPGCPCPYLRKDGTILTVFPDKFNPGYWKYGIDGDFSGDSYPTEEAAKLALFEQYWENLYTLN